MVIKSDEENALLGIWEVGELAGVSPQAVSNWRVRSGDFPKPVANLHSGPVFRRKDIILWLEKRQARASVAQPPGKGSDTRRVIMDDKNTAGQLAAVINRLKSSKDQETVSFIADVATKFGATGLPRAQDAASPNEFWLVFSRDSRDYFLNIVPSWGGKVGDHLAVYCPRNRLEELRNRIARHLGVDSGQLEAWNAKIEHTDSQNIPMSEIQSKAALRGIVAVVGWLAEEAERAA